LLLGGAAVHAAINGAPFDTGFSRRELKAAWSCVRFESGIALPHSTIRQVRASQTSNQPSATMEIDL